MSFLAVQLPCLANLSLPILISSYLLSILFYARTDGIPCRGLWCISAASLSWKSIWSLILNTRHDLHPGCLFCCRRWLGDGEVLLTFAVVYKLIVWRGIPPGLTRRCASSLAKWISPMQAQGLPSCCGLPPGKYSNPTNKESLTGAYKKYSSRH